MNLLSLVCVECDRTCAFQWRRNSTIFKIPWEGCTKISLYQSCWFVFCDLQLKVSQWLYLSICSCITDCSLAQQKVCMS